jgi:hypothetical protein
MQGAVAHEGKGLKDGFEWLASEIGKTDAPPNPFHNPNYQPPNSNPHA